MTEPRDPLDEIKLLEAKADAVLASSPLLGLAARGLLAGLHYSVFLGLHGRALPGKGDGGVGETILQRLSHALPLIRDLPAEPFGVGADDAIGAFQDSNAGGGLSELLSYLHFSELMPEVHRGYYRVEALEKEGFKLSHPDNNFAEGQAKDITLSEIALPFPTDAPGAIEREFGRLAASAPEIWEFAPAYIAANAYKYRHGLAEADLVTDASINHIFGFDRRRFFFIRSVVLAFAEFCDKLATAMHGLILAGRLPEERMTEALEWTSVNMNADFLIGLFAAASESEASEVERFLEIYTIDFRQTPARHWGGDGFFPPFARFEQGYLFSPIMVLAFLQVRNAVFAFAKKEKRRFDNDVSKELEPVLLHQAAELLRRGGDWVVVEDVAFPGGQIDLVVASPDDDVVLLVQAKGNLPPQGARLTDRLAARVREGVAQIQKFEGLAEDDQQRVVERALGRRIARVEVRHAILVRSCFGAVEVFAAEFPYVRLTLPLLALALEHHRNAGLATTVDGLVQAISETEKRVFEQSAYRWEEGQIVVAGSTIRMPLLKWLPGSVETLRREWWASTMRPEQQ